MTISRFSPKRFNFPSGEISYYFIGSCYYYKRGNGNCIMMVYNFDEIWWIYAIRAQSLHTWPFALTPMHTCSHPWTLLRYSEVTDWVKVSCDPKTPYAADRLNWIGEPEKILSRHVTWRAGQIKQVQVRGKQGVISWQDLVSSSCEVSTQCLLSVRRPLTWEAEAAANTLSLPRCRGGFLIRMMEVAPASGQGSAGGVWMKEQQSCQLWQWRKQFVLKIHFSVHSCH